MSLSFLSPTFFVLLLSLVMMNSCSQPGSLGTATDQGGVDTISDTGPAVPEIEEGGDVLHNAAPPERPPSTVSLDPHLPNSPAAQRAMEQIEEREERSREALERYEEESARRRPVPAVVGPPEDLGMIEAEPVEPAEPIDADPALSHPQWGPWEGPLPSRPVKLPRRITPLEVR